MINSRVISNLLNSKMWLIKLFFLPGFTEQLVDTESGGL